MVAHNENKWRDSWNKSPILTYRNHNHNITVQHHYLLSQVSYRFTNRLKQIVHKTWKNVANVAKIACSDLETGYISWSSLVRVRCCLLALGSSLFWLDTLPHTAKFSKLHQVRYCIAQAWWQEGRVNCGLPRFPAAQQRLESLMPEDGVQLEPVLGDVGAVVSTGVGAHRGQQRGLIQRRRKRWSIVMKLLRHLVVKQHLAVLEASCHHVRPMMSAATRTPDIQTDSTVDTRQGVATVSAARTTPCAAILWRWRWTWQRLASPPPASRHYFELVCHSLSRGWWRIPHRHVDSSITNRKTVDHFHGSVAETSGKRVLPGTRHVVGVISAHNATDCQRRHRNYSPGRGDDHARCSSRCRWVLGRSLIVRTRSLMLLHICIRNRHITISAAIFHVYLD